jgi:integrase
MQKDALAYRDLQRFNVGFIKMATVKIYNDNRNGRCECGEKLLGKRDFPGFEPGVIYKVPSCNKCGSIPSKFVIKARCKDSSGKLKDIKIRHAQDGRRLENVYDCIYTLRQIDSELKNGIFDIRRYESQRKKESYLFKNAAGEYISFHSKRYEKGEITKSGLKDKKVLTKHLINFFGHIDVKHLNESHIETFKEEFSGSKSNLYKCLSELRTIYKRLIRKKLVVFEPDFGIIRPSKKRQKIMSSEEGFAIIQKLEDQRYRDVAILMTQYPVRPGEIVTLQQRDIDFRNGEITFQRHLSDGEIIEGRKSRKTGEQYSKLTLPLTVLARGIFEKYPRSLNREEFIFKGAKGKNISLKALNTAWNKAKKEAGYTPNDEKKFHLYELKHNKISSLMEKSNGNFKLVADIAGVDVKTLIDRYWYNQKNVVDILQ